MAHIIQKQVLEFSLEDGAEKMQLQDDLVRLFKEKLLPEMDQVFDELIPSGETWSFNRLEIDLGQLSLDTFKDRFIDELRKNLLQGKAQQAHLATPNLQVFTSGESLWQQFIHFLKYGHFAWNANGLSLVQMDSEIREVLRGMGVCEKQELLSVLRQEPPLQRFAVHFSTDAQKLAVQALAKHPAVQSLLHMSESVVSEKLQSQLWHAAMKALVQSGSEKSTDFVTKFILQLRKGKVDEELEDALRPKLLSILPALRVRGGEDPALEELLKIKDEPRKPQASEEPTAQNTGPATEAEEQISIYIRNAGLVLLWPYLQAFFQNLKLTPHARFSDRLAQEKAVVLLQKLGFPDRDVAENQLPLNKLLCGLDPHDLVSCKEDVLSKELMNEGEALLKSLIKNWGKLANTSVAGFQQSFLQREGKLQKQESSWLLKVEQRSFDMLLDSLPWSLNFIKLPWMQSPLQVEW